MIVIEDEQCELIITIHFDDGVGHLNLLESHLMMMSFVVR